MQKLLVKHCQLVLVLLVLTFILIIELRIRLINKVFVVVVLLLVQKNVLSSILEYLIVAWIDSLIALSLRQTWPLVWLVHRLLRLAGVLHLNQKLLGLVLSVIIIISNSGRILACHLALSSVLAVELVILGEIVGVCAAK